MDDEELAEGTKVTQEYFASLYKMSKYQLREEIHDLYLRCFMLCGCVERLEKEITKLLDKED